MPGPFSPNAQINTDVAGQLVSGPPGSALNVGFRNIPQNSQSANYTTVLNDSGWQIYHPTTDASARNYTIASNAAVPYEIGAAISFFNDLGAGVITIAINGGDTLIFSGVGTTGSRTLPAGCSATAVKVAPTRWMISGPGLT